MFTVSRQGVYRYSVQIERFAERILLRICYSILVKPTLGKVLKA